jgi:UDP-glucose 4-epimerase
LKILLTGASSFTGLWFALVLTEASHEVTATFRGTADSYADTRAERVARILDKVEPI